MDRGHHQRIQIIDPWPQISTVNVAWYVPVYVVVMKTVLSQPYWLVRRRVSRPAACGSQVYKLYGLDIRGQEDRLGNDQAVAAVLILEEKEPAPPGRDRRWSPEAGSGRMANRLVCVMRRLSHPY